MLPSSRTPEGQPNRCPICGHEVCIEPSVPPGDAPCPYCNSLLWFEPVKAEKHDLLTPREQTKQIEYLTAEITALLDADFGEAQFYESFLRLVIASLAAVGGAVWKAETKKNWLPWRRTRKALVLVCQVHLPERLLNSSREAMQHRCLLESLMRSPGKRLVQPVSRAVRQRDGGNPTNQLLLVQPLGDGSEVRGIVEIFCRPVDSTVTQREYQSFVESMCQFEAKFHERRMQAAVV